MLVGSCLLLSAHAQRNPAPAFTIIPLGVRGGLDESNLSAYLVKTGNEKNSFVSMPGPFTAD